MCERSRALGYRIPKNPDKKFWSRDQQLTRHTLGPSGGLARDNKMEEKNPHKGYAISASKVKKSPDWCNGISEAAAENVLEKFTVPAKSGKAWKVLQGQTCKFSLPEGSQVGDVNLWNLHNFDVNPIYF